MAKITVETKGPITSEKDIDIAMKVARRFYILLSRARAHRVLEEMVEIVKAVLWTERIEGIDVQFITFHLVILPPSTSPLPKMRIRVEFDSRRKRLFVLEDKKEGGEPTCIGYVSLPVSPIDTFARALITATRISLAHFRRRLEDLTKWFERREKDLEPLEVYKAS